MNKKGCSGAMVTWIVAALAVWLTSLMVPGVHISRFFPDALLVAAVLGLLNALLRPVLVVLTFPITLLTFGLFLLVINGIVLKLAAALLAGFTIQGIWPAVVAGLVLSILSTALDWLFFERR